VLVSNPGSDKMLALFTTDTSNSTETIAPCRFSSSSTAW
jgi:hypothetical protein